MDGYFSTDITRDSFRPFRHFSRVLMQQGRVQLDADWNEQVDILLHYLRTFIADAVGPFGGPDDSFLVGQAMTTDKPPQPVKYQLSLQKGHYYVDGILIENDHDATVNISSSASPVSYFIYLDIWEREVTYLEDTHIREIALGGPDTATRSEVVWKVRYVDPAVIAKATGKQSPDPSDLQTYNTGNKFLLRQFAIDWANQLQAWKHVDHGHLQAQIPPAEPQHEPCPIPPSSLYRGLENQLYRVEIHDGSTYNSDGTVDSSNVTFKWSRDNGSVVFSIIGPVAAASGVTTLTLTLGNFGRDNTHFGLHVDDRVEIVDVQEEGPKTLMQVSSINYPARQVTLSSTSPVTIPAQSDPPLPLLLRRWDYRQGDPSQPTTPTIAGDGALQLVEGKWLTLENGIEVWFTSGSNTTTYRTGDYWLIPARTAQDKIEWPSQNNEPASLPPHGVRHHYAPLAYVTLTNGTISGQIDPKDLSDLRSIITPVAQVPANPPKKAGS